MLIPMILPQIFLSPHLVVYDYNNLKLLNSYERCAYKEHTYHYYEKLSNMIRKSKNTIA